GPRLLRPAGAAGAGRAERQSRCRGRGGAGCRAGPCPRSRHHLRGGRPSQRHAVRRRQAAAAARGPHGRVRRARWGPGAAPAAEGGAPDRPPAPAGSLRKGLSGRGGTMAGRRESEDDGDTAWPTMGIAGAAALGLIVILAAFGGFGSWAALAPLSSAAIAPGE